MGSSVRWNRSPSHPVKSSQERICGERTTTPKKTNKRGGNEPLGFLEKMDPKAEAIDRRIPFSDFDCRRLLPRATCNRSVNAHILRNGTKMAAKNGSPPSRQVKGGTAER